MPSPQYHKILSDYEKSHNLVETLRRVALQINSSGRFIEADVLFT